MAWISLNPFHFLSLLVVMEWRLAAIFLANFLCCLTYDVIAPFYPVEAHHLGLSHFDTGLVFTSMPLAGFVAAPFIGSCLYRLGRRNTFTGGILLMVRDYEGTFDGPDGDGGPVSSGYILRSEFSC